MAEEQAESQRLYEHYHAMADDELLQLAWAIGDLTETAGDMLRWEMKSRGLAAQSGPVASPPAGSVWSDPFADESKASEIELTTFYEETEAGRACQFLDEHEIAFELKDVSTLNPMGRQVVLKLFVEVADHKRAMEVLRTTMGLFPLQEVEVADTLVDDGTISVMGVFALREDADYIAGLLDEAHIWHRVAANPDGTAENEDLYLLEVCEFDLMRAGEVVERATDA